MILSPHEMAFLLKWAGIPDKDIQIGVACGCAESGGDTEAMGRSKTGTNIGQRDHGWLQISGRWNWDKLIKLGDWRDPWANALMGAAVYNEAVRAGKPGWSPWSTFNGTNPSYLNWMPDAAFGVAHPFPPPDQKTTAGHLDTLTAQLADLKGQVTNLKTLLDQLRTQLASEAALNYIGTITLAPKV